MDVWQVLNRPLAVFVDNQKHNYTYEIQWRIQNPVKH